MRVHTTNGRLIDFAYKPGSAEEAELVAAGQSTEQAASFQYFHVTPEGVELPERVGAYALNLYSTQMKAMGNGAREAGVAEALALSGDDTPDMTVSDNTNVEISGEEDAPPQPDVAMFPTLPGAGEDVSGGPLRCLACDALFEAKTDAAAKGKLTRHTKKEHGA